MQKEGLFGRLVSTVTSEIIDHKTLCMLQNNNFMVQIESYQRRSNYRTLILNISSLYIFNDTKIRYDQKS